MAISKEELKQMLDSTIIANGQKGITAESLNNALTAIIEAMGTGSGAGSEYVDMTMVDPKNSEELTPEAMAHNVEVYNKLINALSTTGPVPAVSFGENGFCIFAKAMMAMEEGTITLIMDYTISDMTNARVSAVDTTGEELPMFIIGSFNVLFMIGLNQDGSVMIEMPGLM